MAAKNLLKTFKEKNLVESATEVASSVKKATAEELSREWRIAMTQMLGIEDKASKAKAKLEGELQEGEEVSFLRQEVKLDIEPGIDYRREVVHAQEKIQGQENAELRAKLEQITIELKQLSKSSKQIEATFQSVSVENLPVNPGKYHLNFFEWVLATIQTARIRIEDSAAWVGVISNKKSKKDYWSLAKSKGTSFSLSSERVVAQQVG